MRHAVAAAALAALLLTPRAKADELTPEKRATILKLMEVTGSANLSGQMAGAFGQLMFDALKTSRPDIPPRALDVMSAELSTYFKTKLGEPGQFLDLVVPIYDQHFTLAELRQLVAFYESPIGKKAIGEMPAIMQESMAVGQRWGESLAPEIQERLVAALRREKLLEDPR